MDFFCDRDYLKLPSPGLLYALSMLYLYTIYALCLVLENYKIGRFGNYGTMLPNMAIAEANSRTNPTSYLVLETVMQ